MTQKMLAPLVLAALFVASGCTNSEPLAPASNSRPLFSQAPANGNGNKEVIPIDAQFPDAVTCPSGATLSLHAVGWIQIWVTSQPNNRNVTLDAVNVVFTFTNAAGEAFPWHEAGIDQFYTDNNGDLIDIVIGRIGFPGVIGRLVINTVTGEVEFVAGNEIPNRNDQACAALT